jgi:branched-chain amino acid transport system permease protein
MPHVELGDVRMHYVERGHGDEALVCLGGFISSHRWWLPTLERLSAARYHAYAVDLRGTGESEAPDGGDTIARHAEDVNRLAGALGLGRFTLVGHSLGGGVAMQYALAHQDRLKALVLLHPLSPKGTRHLPPEVVAWVNAQCGVPEGIRAIILSGCVNPPDEAYLEQLVRDGVGWRSSLYLGMMAEMARFDVTARLGDLAVPTLVTWGDRDTVIPFDGIATAFAGIPNCGLEVWHGAAHNSALLETPDRLVALLDRFLAGIDGPTA